MRFRLTLLRPVALAVLLIAACTTAPATSPSGTAAGTAASPGGTAASSPAASATGAASPGGSLAFPSFNADPSLEAQLPNQINGKTIQKISFRGQDFLQAGGATDPELAQLFQRLGTSAENLSVAIGFDASGSMDAGVLAIRVAGTDANRVIQELGNAAKSQNAATAITQQTIAGKNVTTIAEPDDPSGALHLYARGDVVFGVTGSDAATAQQLLSQLP
jgi:hypothetical protein